ncbi:enoyl-CoA hydratase/isomerase family protein [Brevibacterium permense]|uniref:enoyl-CoA hydratase/isomerase family protein n=1 Tax=Brevibacterium permense TaxID=234834 RepID=UPI0021D18BC7|nr:enoyl-CoA hydratase/isomerase family protein [Brevibacterium permense]
MNDEDQSIATRGSDDEVLLVEGHGDTEVWRFNRPAARNALNPDLVARLRAELERTKASGIRAVVLAGNGQSFCTGADLKYLIDCAESGADPRPFLQSICDLTVEMEHSPIVFFAAVHGHAVAGGFELALAADVVIAAEGTLIGDGHVKNNLVPGGGSSVRIVSKLGAGHARWLALSGQLIDAAELRSTGWVHEIAAAHVDGDHSDPLVDSPTAVVDRALELAEVVNAVSLDARTRFKARLVGDRAVTEAALSAELDKFDEHWRSSDVIADLRAFFNSRKQRTQS